MKDLDFCHCGCGARIGDYDDGGMECYCGQRWVIEHFKNEVSQDRICCVDSRLNLERLKAVGLI